MSDDIYRFFGLEDDFEEDDDKDFQPIEDNDDEEEDINQIELAPENSNLFKYDITRIIQNMEKNIYQTSTTSNVSNIVYAPLPKTDEIPNSPFTVEQWDVLRHQIRVHFSLLCRSLRFSTFSSSGDGVIAAILVLLHTLNIVFKSSIETAKDLNHLFKENLFVSVFGNPEKSLLHRIDDIIYFFRNGGLVEDLLEKDFFQSIFKSFPTKGINKPLFLNPHSSWVKEEDDLLEVALKRFKTPDEIRRWVIPNRNISVINKQMEKFVTDQTKPVSRSVINRNNEQNDYKVYEESEDEEIYVVDPNAVFQDVTFL